MRSTARQVSQSVEFVKKGQVTIPKRLRDKYGIVPGQKGTIVELEGAFLITPTESKIPALFDELREELGTSDMSLEEMVARMRGIRDADSNG